MKKITISNGTLKSVLKQFKDIVPLRPMISVLNTILFDVAGSEVTLTCTDLEVTIITSINCENSSNEDFRFLVPFDFLYRISDLNGDISLQIAVTDVNITITGVNDCFCAAAEPVIDFPVNPVFPSDGKSIKVDADFVNCLASALHTVSTESLRPTITKVCVDIQKDKTTIVSTNTQQLFSCVYDIKSKSTDELLVGAKFIRALNAFAETEILWSKNHIAFRCGDTTVITTRLTDKYPPWRDIVPAYECNIDFETSALQLAIKKAMISSSGSSGLAKLSLKAKIGAVSINASDDGDFSSRIDMPADYKGDVESVNIPIGGMLKALSQIPFGTVSLAIHAPNKAILLRSSEDPRYLGLVMPLITA